ncbi:Heparinase II/III N-terminus [Streptosporangium subroseum]|uniref:Heparinase II/III N-terminus n=1 Tax=Streptosporangium subroseum TaxID=106412 RepID=A0A239MJF3_9ACTN|nr:heparinase II/III family protein [Streptosporangium subroseum]SNT42785.1 Heparinase II/III N-terminus [Streptosporangium subroseum]
MFRHARTALGLTTSRSVAPSLATSDGPVIRVAGQFPEIKVSEVMEGRVTFVGLPAVDVGTDIDWHLNPHQNRSWALNLHALRWMGRLVVQYERSGKREYLDRAAGIAEDWVRKNPRGGAGLSPWAWAEHPVALRAPALVCLSAYVRSGWLSDSLIEHARILSDAALYKEGHNHGLDQDIALLAIGCRLGHERWKDLAIRRMTRSARLAIDAQGVLHEQAPRYGVYVHRRLGVAMEAIRSCGAEIPADLAARRRSLETYVSHATQPDGRLVPIGDSPADVRPEGFPHEEDTVKVFDGGYVFGRTAWNDARSAHYSIRFGPGRRLHGHEDHLGVTYHAQGRDILVEAGFHSYEKTPYRKWTTSPEAHNVPIVVGAEFREGTATRLVGSSVERTRQSYRLTDTAYGVSRTRSVLVNHGADLMAVLDSVPASSRLRNLWHFGPSLRVISNHDGRVVLADGDWRATLLQFAMPSCRPISGQTVRPGAISPRYLEKAEVATVLSPPVSSVLTLIVPGTADPKVSWSGATVTVGTPGGPVSFVSSPDQPRPAWAIG